MWKFCLTPLNGREKRGNRGKISPTKNSILLVNAAVRHVNSGKPSQVFLLKAFQFNFPISAQSLATLQPSAR